MMQPSDTRRITELCRLYLFWMRSNRCSSGNFEHHIFEAAMEAVFGTGIWDLCSSLTEKDELSRDDEAEYQFLMNGSR